MTNPLTQENSTRSLRLVVDLDGTLTTDAIHSLAPQHGGNMNAKRMLAIWITCLGFAQSSLAEGLKALPYTSVDVSYERTEYDGNINAGGNGININASSDIDRNTFVFAGYGFSETDDFDLFGYDGSIRSSAFSIGLGYHYPLHPKVDLVPTATLSRVTSKARGFYWLTVRKDTAWSVGLKLRSLVTPHIELAGGVDYIYVYDDGDTAFNIGGFFYPVNRLGVGVSYNASDDFQTFVLSTRVVF